MRICPGKIFPEMARQYAGRAQNCQYAGNAVSTHVLHTRDFDDKPQILFSVHTRAIFLQEKIPIYTRLCIS
jgi:hypothetical protein